LSYSNKAKGNQASSDRPLQDDPELPRTCPKNLNPVEAMKLIVLCP
jgi:hypothetical protein